jgi:hypothetical protein
MTNRRPARDVVTTAALVERKRTRRPTALPLVIGILIPVVRSANMSV